MSKFTLTLDASQIAEFQMCPLKWYYHYQEHLRLDGISYSAPDKGTLIHSLCDLYYNLRWIDPNGNKMDHMNEAIRIFREHAYTLKLFPQDNGELETFLVNRFCLYVQRYAINDFVLPTSTVSPIELGFSKLLYEDDSVRFIVEGRIDLISLVNGNTLCFVDHKTQDRKSELYKYKPQFKTYAWATGCEYGLVNYIGLQDKYVEGNTFRRTLINFPKWMIEEWEIKMLQIFWRVTNLINHLDNIEQVVYNERNDSNCGGAFDSNPCAFTHLCEIGDWEMKQALKKFKYKKVEPWSPWSLIEAVKE